MEIPLKRKYRVGKMYKHISGNGGSGGALSKRNLNPPVGIRCRPRRKYDGGY